jgi:fatty-acyl-CoA synthase
MTNDSLPAELNPRLSNLIAKQLHNAPDSIALFDGERSVSVKQFDQLCRAGADWLLDQGIVAGDRVALWLVNRVEWLALLFGAARIGATIVSVNTRYRATELQYLLAKSGARLLILQHDFRGIDFPAVLAAADPSTLPALEKVALLDEGAMPTQLLGRPCIRLVLPTPLSPIQDASNEASERHAGTQARLDHPAATGSHASQETDDHSDPQAITLLYTTSGTTKGPKLVMHTQRSLAWHAQQVAQSYGMTQGDCALLGALPLCGTFGMTGVLASLAAGAPAILMDAFDGQRAAALVNKHQVTHMFGSDEMYRRMMEAIPTRNPFPSARMFGYAAFAPRGEEFAIDSNARGLPLVGLYGSSEVQALFSVQPAHLPVAERVRGGGQPAATQALVRIRDLETGKLAATGVSGEIEISSPGNFAGYMNDPQATAAVVAADGFFSTGDIGHLREDGSFIYETRRGDAIRLGGFLVNPAEIEDVIKSFPGVTDVGVIGIEIDGQPRCVAFVVLNDSRELEQVQAARAMTQAARDVMANFKVPARIWFIDALPVTASANGTKVQRAKMREMALANLAREHDALPASSGNQHV